MPVSKKYSTFKNNLVSFPPIDLSTPQMKKQPRELCVYDIFWDFLPLFFELQEQQEIT